MKKSLFTLLFALVCAGSMWGTPAVAVNGKLPGAFSVSPTKVVYFSQGNLQYQASTGTWRFAAHQYDYIGNAAGNTTAVANRATQTDWIDLLGWGTSGYNGKNPWLASTTLSDYIYASGGQLPDNYDWGKYNTSQLGNGWRTLTKAEWEYLFSSRSNYSNLCAGATIDGKTGIIVLPDDWTLPDGASMSVSKYYNANSYTPEQWAVLEDAGAVFLPASGNREGTIVMEVNNNGKYWTSTASDDYGTTYVVHLYNGGIPFTTEYSNYNGMSVRLVSETAPPTITETPLTFEAMVAGAVVTYTKNSTKPVQYSLNGGAWTNYSSAITLSNVGGKVSFRGNNDNYNSNDAKFQCSADCYIYGNIMSLVDSTNFATTTTLTANKTFSHMFYNNTHIKNHPSKDFVLPATTLSVDCYYYMFEGCIGLTSAPALPANTLTENCYYCMFKDCTGLTSAPALPATTLATACYGSMFYGCTGLTSAPELPATTLVTNCYCQMFLGCTGLTSAPELPATTLVMSCYLQMFYGCTNLSSVTCYATSGSTEFATTMWLCDVAASGTFYAPKNSVFASEARGTGSIPEGWTFSPFQASLTTAPTAVTGLEYTGSAQALINNDGVAVDGTLNYSLDNTNWSEDIPTGTNAGDYTVYYMVVGDDSHADYTPDNNSVAVTIAPFTLTIKPIVGASFTVNTVQTATVYEVKQLIEAEISIAPEYQRLIFAGKQLENGRTLSEYNITNGKTVNLIYRITIDINANEDPQHAGVYYATFFDSSVKYTLPAGVEAYVATISGENLNLTKIAEYDEVLPENTAVILKANSGSITLTPTDASAVTVSATNDLQGTDEAQDTPANCYVLSCVDDVVGFYRYNGEQVAAHKAYVIYNGGAGAPRRMRFVFTGEQTATGIENTDADANASNAYKLIRDGQLIIIRNGVEYNVNGQEVK